jgi:hypothetical protein
MSEPKEIEETNGEESESQYLVVDPDDYQKTKKLEAIHRAKRSVMEAQENRIELIPRLGDKFYKKGTNKYKEELARRTANYGSELMPLIEEGIEHGTIDDDDLNTQQSTQLSSFNVIDFIKWNGRLKAKGERQYPPEENTLAVYRQLERIQQKLGLGVDLDEQKGPAEI